MIRGMIPALLLCLSLGCAKKAPVEVAFAGQLLDARKIAPTKTIALRFHPADEATKRGRSPTCLVEGGRFEGKALPGKYKVTLTPIGTGTAGNAAGGSTASAETITATPQLQPYLTPTTTPWEVVIPPEGKADIQLELR